MPSLFLRKFLLEKPFCELEESSRFFGTMRRLDQNCVFWCLELRKKKFSNLVVNLVVSSFSIVKKRFQLHLYIALPCSCDVSRPAEQRRCRVLSPLVPPRLMPPTKEWMPRIVRPSQSANSSRRQMQLPHSLRCLLPAATNRTTPQSICCQSPHV